MPACASSWGSISRAAAFAADGARTRSNKPNAALPVDHFNKLGEAEMAARANAQWDIASREMAIDIAHFTAKGEEDKVEAIAEHCRLIERNIPEATRHFHRLAHEGEAASEPKKTDDMSTATQHFTLANGAITDKKPEVHKATRHFADLEAKKVGKTEAVPM